MARAVANVPAGLLGEEWRLISALREIPSDPVRERLTHLVERLAEFVGDPHCAEMQADGVPCGNVVAACEDCCEIEALLSGLEDRLRRE